MILNFLKSWSFPGKKDPKRYEFIFPVMFSAHFVSAVEFCSRFCLGKKATLELIALGFGGTVVLSDVQSHMSNCSVGY